MGRVGTSVNMMYRSVPPRPLSYTFSDVLQASLQPRTPGCRKKKRSKTAPVSVNAAEEYAERFRSRPTTRPSVIDFNGTGVKMYTGSGGCRKPLNQTGHFPAVKSRSIPPITIKTSKSPVPKLIPQPLTERGTAATSSLHLAPLAKGAEPNTALSLQTKPCRPPPPLPLHSTTPKPSKTPDISRLQGGRSAASSLKSRGKSSGGSHPRGTAGEKSKSAGNAQRPPATAGHAEAWEELTSSKLSTLDAMAFTISPQTDQMAFPDVLAHSDDVDDLSELPRPKRILPRRDLPWVFRFKVKKEMNALSKIMASKPGSANSVTVTGPMV